MKVKTLEELLSQLNREDRKKFEYILNFYTVEHVFYNFEHYKHALSGFKPFLYEEFNKKVPEKVKELISRVDISDVKLYLESFKTSYTNHNSKPVDDLLLYLTMHTTQKESVLIKLVNSNVKYKRLIEDGVLTEKEVLFIIKTTYDEELVRSDDFGRSLDLKFIDMRITEKVKSIMDRRDISRENRFKYLMDLSEVDPSKLSWSLNPSVALRLSLRDIDEAFEKEGNVFTKDRTILYVKACLGDKFKDVDISVIERLKSVFRNYDLNNISIEELDFIGENYEEDIEELYYLKNIVSSEDALRAYSELPEELQERILKYNIVAHKEDVRSVLNALDLVAIKKDEEKRQIIQSEKTSSFPNLEKSISRLPFKKAQEFLEFIKTKRMDFVRENVGLDERITYGIELEMAGFLPEDFRELQKRNEIFNELRKRREIKSSLRGWKIDEEGTVDNGNGLEYITPTMRDKKSDWDELEDACKLVNSLGVRTTDDCGLHIHIGADILGTDEKAWKNLFELWREIEPFAYKMCNKSGEKNRAGILNHAGPTASIIDDMFKKDLVKINSSEDVKKVADEYTRRYIKFKTFSGRTKSMNLQCIAEGKQNTIEFRIPNGELDPVEIQRNVLFFGKIVEVSKKLAEDKEYKKDIFESLKKEKNPNRKVLYILDLLFDDIDSKAVFLDRYYGRDDKLKLAGWEYYDILDEEVSRDDGAKYEWRGHR